MNRTTLTATVLTITGALLLSGCSALQEDAENEIDMDLGDVPADILAAGQAAVPGIEFDSAEYEEEDGQMVYELEGMVGEKRYEIEISESGEIVEIEEIDD